MTTSNAGTAGGRIGPFHLGRILGEGGQGAVWQATDVRTGRVVALKVIRIGLTGPNVVARLRREGAILQSFEHPGLPRGIELVEDQAAGVVALAMEFIEGKTLQQLMAERRLAPREVAKLGLGIARVLAAVHARGIAHRDVKPANIILRNGWDNAEPAGVVLVDFGIARGEDHATKYTALGGAVGTLSFMAPELLMGRPSQDAPLSPALDVYALGVLLWALLSGNHPTGLTMSASVSELVLAYVQPKAPAMDPGAARAVDAVLPGFLSLLAGCLAVQPASRPSAEAVARDLEAILSGANQTGYQAAPAGPASWTAEVRPAAGFTAFTPSPSWTAPAQGPDPSRSAPTAIVQRQPEPSHALPLVLGGLAVLVVGIASAVGFYAADPLDLFEKKPSASRRPAQGPAYSPPPAAQPGPQKPEERTATVFFDEAPCRQKRCNWSEAQATPAERQACEGCSYGSFRASPEGTLLENVPVNTTIQLLGQASAAWCKVSYRGRVGYMHRDILRPNCFQ
jgi:serine/threonine protein kinase